MTPTPEPGENWTPRGEPLFARFVRLTHSQWENSVRDLLRLDQAPGLSESFIDDPPDGRFSNNELALYVTGALRSDYQIAAETLAEQVAQNPAARSRVTNNVSDPAVFIRNFGWQAYRRPLTPSEEQRLLELFNRGAELFGSGDAFANGVQLAIGAILQSPQFIYRIELTPEGQRLSGHELATKLSFLLHNTTPSNTLLDAAERGELDGDQSFRSLVNELIGQVSTQEVMSRFHTEMFGLQRYSSIYKDPQTFPSYSTSMNRDLIEADLLFFKEIFSESQGLRDILLSPVAYVNESTAPIYGVTASGSELTRVTLGSTRPGYFTRIGFLAYNGSLRDPDPIHRGVDINIRLLCVGLVPPPGIIPALPEYQPGQTNRERVEKHTGEGTCGAGCHSVVINPLGFAFENFDALGQERSIDNGKPVDTSGEYAFADGRRSFANTLELIDLLAESEQAHRCYAASLAEFALGRSLAPVDRDWVLQLRRGSLYDNTSLKEMLMSVVNSPAFTHRQGGRQ